MDVSKKNWFALISVSGTTDTVSKAKELTKLLSALYRQKFKFQNSQTTEIGRE